MRKVSKVLQSSFWGCFESVSGRFLGNLMGVNRTEIIFQEFLKVLSRLFHGNFKSLSKVFQGCLKNVSLVFHGCFKEASSDL